MVAAATAAAAAVAVVSIVITGIYEPEEPHPFKIGTTRVNIQKKYRYYMPLHLAR
jgi:hypothetical protein